MPIWDEAVKNAIRRHVVRTGSPIFSRQALINSEIGSIITETRTAGATPTQTLGRELQQLRNAGLIEFPARGTYRWLGDMPEPEPLSPSKGVFVFGSNAISGELLELRYRFSSQWLQAASRMAGQWIIYQREEGREYQAAAQVASIDPSPDRDGSFAAQIAGGSYLEFGRAVPFEFDDAVIERGLLGPDGQLNGMRAA